MSQVGSAFVVVKPIVADFRAEVAQGVNRSLGSATIPIPVTPSIPRGSSVTWEKLATGASVPKVVPLPVQPTITPAAKAAFGSEVAGLRGGLLGTGQFAASRALGISGLAAGIFAFGLAATKATKLAATLEEELNVFQQVSGATADEMARVAEEARKLGSDIQLPAVSAGDAAATMTDLAKAGLSVDEVLEGTRGTLQLATAANLDFATSADLAANALNAFQLPGTDAIQVADLLAGAANAAQGDIADFGLGLSQTAAVAHQAGLSLQETVTFLTEFAKAGISGSDAGTSLRVALLRLIAPTKEAKDIFGALGVNLAGFQAGRIRAPEFFEQLQRAMAPLDKATRNAALATVFGNDAIRVASIAVRDAGANWDTLTENVSRAGIAQEAADARTKGLSGKVSGLASNLETLGTDLGTLVIPALSEFVDGLNAMVSAMDKSLIATEDFFKGFGSAVGDAGAKIGDSGFGKFVANAAGATIDFGNRARRATDDVLGLRGAIEATGQVAPLQFPNLTGFAGAGDRTSPQFDRAAEQAKKRATEAGAEVGKAFTLATGREITKQEQSVIDAAKKTVRDAQAAMREVVAEGARAVDASAISAKQNLTSIGQGLATQVLELVDTGPLAQRLKVLQEQLDRSRAGIERGSLRRSLRDAQEALQRAQDQLVGGAPQTALTRAGNRRFLRPFEEDVKDAQAALAEFDTQGSIDKLANRLDATKVRIQRTLDSIIAKFNAGLLSGPQVNAQVAALLQKNVGPMAKAGKAQGFAFKEAFSLQLAALQEQIAAILGGPRTAKTGAEPTIVKPADALRTATANRLAAERSVKDAIIAVGKAQKDAVTAKGGTNDLLAQILAQLSPQKSQPKPSSTVTTPKPTPRVGGRR